MPTFGDYASEILRANTGIDISGLKRQQRLQDAIKNVGMMGAQAAQNQGYVVGSRELGSPEQETLIEMLSAAPKPQGFLNTGALNIPGQETVNLGFTEAGQPTVTPIQTPLAQSPEYIKSVTDIAGATGQLGQVLAPGLPGAVSKSTNRPLSSDIRMITSALFDTEDFNSLDREQKNQVLQGVSDFRARIAGSSATARAEATEEVKLGSPLGAAELNRFVDRQGRNPKPGTTMRDIISGGDKYISQTAAQESARLSLQATDTILTQLEGLIERLPLPTSTSERLAAAPRFAAGAYLQTEPDIALYHSTANGVLANIVRALGEKGTLTDGDIGRAKNLIPKAVSLTGPDTREVATRKLGQLRELIAEISSRSSGFTPPSGERIVTRDRIQRELKSLGIDEAAAPAGIDTSGMSDDDIKRELGIQ